MPPLTIGTETILSGERKKIYLEIPRLYDFTNMTMPVEVIRGKKDGPTLLVSAAIHGDEILGVDIARRLLQHSALKHIRGTLIVVPIVNVFGFNSKMRYLPDRRDLNRCFPGDKKGSLGAQMAHIFSTEIISHCTHAIDLHTGAVHRSNLPQIRADLDNAETRGLAEAFGTSVIMNSRLRDGSLRAMVSEKNIPMLLFEGGEALRFDPKVSKIGLHGILSVMHEIGMIQSTKYIPKRKHDVFTARSSYWIRAPYSGIFLAKKQLGEKVSHGELLGDIISPFGDHSVPIVAITEGIVIGNTSLPLANEGDALFHIATFSDVEAAHESVELEEEFDIIST